MRQPSHGYLHKTIFSIKDEVVFLVKRFNNTARHRLFPTHLAKTGEEKAHTVYFETVLRIRIRRIRMFWTSRMHPDPLVTSTDPDPDPSLST